MFLSKKDEKYTDINLSMVRNLWRVVCCKLIFLIRFSVSIWIADFSLPLKSGIWTFWIRSSLQQCWVDWLRKKSFLKKERERKERKS